MRKLLLLLFSAFFFACQNEMVLPADTPAEPPPFLIQRATLTDTRSWAYFLQHLPVQEGTIIDYKGQVVPDQEKKFSLLSYDVGKRDLQQCADALIRLRSEYLFSQQRYEEIHFQFTDGTPYSFDAYVRGSRPIQDGNRVRFINTQPASFTCNHFRQYLDLVFAYAGTISLARELKNTEDFTIGTVVLTPGSPGHCMIITDMATTPAGDTLYKLVEGYTPAQSIYVLRNLEEPHLGYWHRLDKGVICTASYTFQTYQLKSFE